METPTCLLKSHIDVRNVWPVSVLTRQPEPHEKVRSSLPRLEKERPVQNLGEMAVPANVRLENSLISDRICSLSVSNIWWCISFLQIFKTSLPPLAPLPQDEKESKFPVLKTKLDDTYAAQSETFVAFRSRLELSKQSKKTRNRKFWLGTIWLGFKVKSAFGKQRSQPSLEQHIQFALRIVNEILQAKASCLSTPRFGQPKQGDLRGDYHLTSYSYSMSWSSFCIPR